MYIVNNTKFFDFGVDAGDVRVRFALFQLSTPIQFFGRPQSRLFVSHLFTLSPTCRGMVATYTMNIFCLVLSHSLLHDFEKIFSKVQKFE